MRLSEYQQAAQRTDQRPEADLTSTAIAILGLAGEAGSVAAEYKKYLRDGPAHKAAKIRLREELGDVLWYVAALATKFNLDLDDIAVANLSKVTDLWRPSPEIAFFDTEFPESEQLPRQARFEFTTVRDAGREYTIVTRLGEQFGDPLTDASHVEDHYRFHDVFHLSHAAVLGWSPVTRKMLGCKRRSNPQIDEAEDGGRAIVIEEGVAALVFAYASAHNYLAGVTRLDQQLLTTIQTLVAPLEVSVRRAADWQQAIFSGYDAWRKLSKAGGGVVEMDLDTRQLRVQ